MATTRVATTLVDSRYEIAYPDSMKRVSVFLLLCVSFVSVLMTPRANAADPTPLYGIEKGVVLGHVSGNGFYRTVVVEGNYAYAGFQTAEFETSLTIIDIVDKQTPSIIGEYNAQQSFRNFAVAKQFAYIIGQNELLIVDATDPSASELVATYAYEHPQNVVYHNNTLFLLTRETLFAYSIDDPTILIEVGSLPIPNANARDQMVIVNNRAFVHTQESINLQVVDLSDLSKMKVIGSLDGIGGVAELAIGVDRYVLYDGGCSSICSVYVGLFVYEPITFETEEKGWASRLAYWDGGLAIDGPYAYAGHSEGISVFDLITDEDNFESNLPVAQYDIFGAWDIDIEGDYIYANGRSGFYIGLAMPRDDVYLPLLLHE